MRKVFFHFANKKIHLNNRVRIKNFISEIFRKEKIDFTRIDYVFCSDRYLLRINKNFLHHSYYTDVISFTLNNNPLSGEIYISIDRVKDNSKKYSVFFKQEILRVIFHGALHLCGYLDKTKKERELMSLMENKYLNLFEQFSKENTPSNVMFHVKPKI